MWTRSVKWLQEKISSIFYTHGLFCASHPVAIILFVILIFLILCYPLTTLPLPGNPPLIHETQLGALSAKVDNSDSPRWFQGDAVFYVQQIIVKAIVSPWQPKILIETDAFRGPLSTAFDVMETINNFVIRNGSETLSLNDVCYRVSEPISREKLRHLVPSYNCLVVSPVNFWNNNRQTFNDDDQIIKTIYNNYGQTLDAPPSVRDILLGLPLKDTGIARFYLRNRQRVISYAVTIVMKDYNPRFLAGLEEKLMELYPNTVNTTANRKVIHFYFKDINYFVEYTPLLVTYIVLFMYLYFSVSKIEMVKSKWGLALSAVVTVLSSLLISVSVCTLFGLTPSLNGSEIFPYLVVIIGLENVLVVTKSVVSTPMHLDVKLRVAQGLSKEGWYIFKNLMTELLILFIGFFTFVPAIQEFCAFGLVGLVSDFFIQMFFYTTVLSIDIRRMELSDLQRQSVQITLSEGLNGKGTLTKKNFNLAIGTNMPIPVTSSTLLTPPPSPTRPTAPVFASYDDMFFPEKIWKTPRRVRFMNYWARTRILQRGIMLFVILWILLIVCKTGLVEYLDTEQESDPMPSVKVSPEEQNYHPYTQAKHDKDEHIPIPQDNHRSEAAMVFLQHDNLEPWKDLSHMHWPTLLRYYNVSLLGRYLSLLPSIHLSMVISPEVAIQLRNDKEAASLQDYDDTKETYKPDEGIKTVKFPSPTPSVLRNFFRYPRTRKEQVITVLLGIASAVLLTFLIVSLYRCMCSRNYAKWRSSWSKTRRSRFNWPYYKQIRESVPLFLQGHLQEVESLAIDGSLIVSACLGGQIRLWDISNGDCLTAIHRNEAKPRSSRSTSLADMDQLSHNEGSHVRNMHSSVSSLPTSYSVAGTKPRDSKSTHSRHLSVDFHNFFPDLTGSIETDFGSMYESRKPSSGHSRQNSFGGISYPPVSQDSPLALTPASKNSPISPSPLSPNSMYSNSPFLSNCVDNQVDPVRGFNFSHVNGHYLEHSKNLQERLEYLQQRKERLASQESMGDGNEDVNTGRNRVFSWSQGGSPNTLQVDATQIEQEFVNKPAPPVWCLACQGSLIVAGCANGRIEFWEGLTGCLKCIYSDSKTGVTALSFVGNKVVAARLNGVVDFLEVVSLSDKAKPPTPTALQSQLFNRAQLRRVGSIPRMSGDMKSWDDEITIKLIATTRPHQRPINVMKAVGGMVITASQDHTLKVSRIEDTSCLFTLHGHNGPVSALYVDERLQPLTGASGSEDCTVRLWNITTGGCLHKLEGHKSTVTSLTCTNMYVVSTGLDDRLCIWERIKGHLLHWIQMEPGYCNSVAMLTNKLMVTGGQGCIYLWDVSKGRALRAIQLGDDDHSIFVRQVHVVNNTSVVCDYGSQLQVIHFPAVLEKVE